MHRSTDRRTESRPPARRDILFELFILALSLFSLLMIAAYYLLPLTGATKEAILWLDVPTSLVFLADSFRSLRRAADKRAFLKWGWLDFAGSIPLVLPLRIARLRRLIGIWRTLRTWQPSEVGEDLDRNRAQGAALITVLLAIVVLTIATVAVLEFESEVPGANIDSAGDAFWWSIVTMATVGYGDFYPITPWGRVAAVGLMTVGVGIFGVLASYLANFFLPKSQSDGDPQDLAEVKAELAAVKTQLDAIQTLLGDRVPPPPGDSDAEPG